MTDETQRDDLSPASDERLKSIWSTYSLVRVSPDQLAKRNISDDTRSILENVGLPQKTPLSVTLYADERLLESLVYQGVPYLTLGDDYGTKIAMSERKEELWSIGPGSQLPRRFINSSLRQFLAALGIYVSRQEELRMASDEEAIDIVAAIREQLTKVDHNALADPESWWSVVLEQTEQGLM